MMEDTEKQSSQIMEAIPQQPQITRPATISSPDISSNNGNSHPQPIRKQRGIFTTSNSMVRINQQSNMTNGGGNNTQPWTVQNGHISGLESGDNANVANYRGQFIQNRNRVTEEELNNNNNNNTASTVAGGTTASTVNNVVSNQSAETEEHSQSSAESPNSTGVQSPFVEDADNLIGNYQVNPFDGSLVKIIHQPVDGSAAKEDIETDIKVKQENIGMDSRDWSTDFDSDGLQTDQNCRRKYRKRKFRDASYDDEEYLPNNASVRHAAGIPKPTGDKAEEVLKAAKSLFSKRTRTLYHWLYPSTSKLELKNIVVSAWDTLQESEKHFYISQVLGRFGFPASNLMVNPQIGGLQGMPTDHLRNAFAMGATGFTTTGLNGCPTGGINVISNGTPDATTKRVVEELLANNAAASENDVDWKSSRSTNHDGVGSFGETRRKRRKYMMKSDRGGVSSPNGSCENNENSLEYMGGDDDESNPPNLDDEDFQNDPELSQELATFKMNTTVDVIDVNGESDELLQVVQI